MSGLRKMTPSSTMIRTRVAIMIMASVSPAASLASTINAVGPVTPIFSSLPWSWALPSVRSRRSDSRPASAAGSFSAETTLASAIFPSLDTASGEVAMVLKLSYRLACRSAVTFATVALSPSVSAAPSLRWKTTMAAGDSCCGKDSSLIFMI